MDVSSLWRVVSGARKVSPAETENRFLWKERYPVVLVRSARARRYLLRWQNDGTVRLTLPRRGSRAEALRFLQRSEAWLEKRHAEWQSRQAVRQPWQAGSRFLFRGAATTLRVETDLFGVQLFFADQELRHVPAAPDYRSLIQGHLRVLAERELPVRTRELAVEHGIEVGRVSVRAQTTRWGSCSARGTISLNWRLILAPLFVLDYLIIHELMHRREMNHSSRYWKLVAEAFPRWREAEAWLKRTRIEMLEG